jgi:hypothetical protein
VISLESDGTLATIAYTILVPDVEAVEQIYTLASLIGNGFIRAMCGPAWRAHEIQLPFRRPADIMAYRQAYEAPLRFDASRAAIVFAASTLRRERRPPAESDDEGAHRGDGNSRQRRSR